MVGSYSSKITMIGFNNRNEFITLMCLIFNEFFIFCKSTVFSSPQDRLKACGIIHVYMMPGTLFVSLEF